MVTLILRTGEERMKNKSTEDLFSAELTYQDAVFCRYYLLSFIPIGWSPIVCIELKNLMQREIGFFSRLIVKSMSCLKWKVTDYWKNGVALNEDTNNLILELDEARKGYYHKTDQVSSYSLR